MADSKAENNVQHSLAKIEGAEKTAPIPQSNVEHYLAKIAGEDVTIPEKPNTTEEYYLENILEVVNRVEESATAAEESAKGAAESASAAALSAAQAQVSVANPFVIAATVAAMTDHTKAYVYTGSETGYVTGGWYYWNGTDWTLGGQATDSTLTVSGAPADAKAAGDRISELKNALNKKLSNIMDLDSMNIGYRMDNNTGELIADELYVASDYMFCEGLQNIMLIARASGSNKTTDVSNPAPGGLYWNFYDADKVFIRAGNTGSNPASVPNNAVFARIRFSKPNYDRSLSTNNLWGVFGVASLSALVNWTFYQVPQNILPDTIYEVDGSKVHPHIISCWGDSLTDGTGDTNPYGWPNRLANLIGSGKVNVNNFGLGGQNSLAIARRMSAMPVYVNPFTIPADTSAVTVSLFDDDGAITSLFNRGSGIAAADLYRACVNPCIISGVEGTLTQTDRNGGYTFARKTTGEAVTVSRPALLETWGYRNQRNDVTIIWAGTNDTSSWQSISWTMENINRMIETLNTDQYIIIGLTAKTLFSDIVSRNNAMFRKFGRRFLDVRKYLLNYGLADVGITPTEQDTTDISNGEIPTSLRSDEVHLNNYGYQGVANCVYWRGQELGYWS